MQVPSRSGRIRLLLGGLCVAALFAGITALAAAQLPPGGTFTDDDGNIHEANIEAIAAEGITRGCNPPTNDRYCPTSPVTRGQMAAFLVRALGLTDRLDDPFVDDDGSIFEADIERLAAAGITRGCNPPTNDRFCPDDHVTRGQMAAFLVRAMGYTDDGGGDLFVDDDDSVFEADIDRLGTAGVTKGCNPPTNDRFCPTDKVLRDQMASFLARALGLAPIVPPPPGSTTTSTTTTTTPGLPDIGTDVLEMYACDGDEIRDRFEMGECVRAVVRSYALKNSTTSLYQVWIGPSGNSVPSCFVYPCVPTSYLNDGWVFYFRDTTDAHRVPGTYRFEFWRYQVGSGELVIRKSFELVP
jgi:hypothetical protein